MAPGPRTATRCRTSEGALDIDLALSPMTNYMPAARLGDKPADHVMAWVDVPSLEVTRSPQRYEPIGPRQRAVRRPR